MAAVNLVLLMLVLVVSATGPGVLLFSRLPWSAAERLCAIVLGSLVVIYLGSLAIYAADLPAASHWILTAAAAAMLFLLRRSVKKMLRSRQVRRILLVYGALWAWTFGLLLMIRHYAGGTWSGDWAEHYQRSLFFLSHGDLHYRFLDQYLLTDRPPLMNLVAAHALAHFDLAGVDHFYLYQAVAASLNLLPAMVLCLWTSSLVRHARRRRVALLALTIFLALNPMFIQNVTYVWTKSFAASLALFGLWLYIRGINKRDSTRIIGAFAGMTAGCMAHFVVVPYLLVMAGHYALWSIFTRRAQLREWAGIVITSGVILGSWFAWAVANYGFVVTFTSNLTIASSRGQSIPVKFAKVGQNLFATIVPFFLRPVPYADFQQNDPLGHVRDLAFCLYQTNAIFMVGVMGCLVLARSFHTRLIIAPQRAIRFCTAYLFIAGLLAIAAAPVAEAWGVAHLALLPVAFMGVAVLAGIFPRLGTRWKIVLLCGFAIDFTLGIALHVWLEHRTFAIIQLQNNLFSIQNSPNSLSHSAQYNFHLKRYLGMTFLGDLAPQAAPWLGMILVVAVAIALICLLRKSVTRK